MGGLNHTQSTDIIPLTDINASLVEIHPLVQTEIDLMLGSTQMWTSWIMEWQEDGKSDTAEL